MMPLLKRATENSGAEWIEVPEGLWRWQVASATVAYSEKFGNHNVRLMLTLVDDEKQRLGEEQPPAPEGKQQSSTTFYRVGLSLGWIKSGAYQTTKLVDFLAACFGSTNQRKFREWIATGGGPGTNDSMEQEEELATISSWLEWWKELEVYGTVRHVPASDGSGKVYANFAGPLPVGSLPGQKDDQYQAFGRGKLRAMVAESRGEVAEIPIKQTATDEEEDGPEYWADVRAKAAAELAAKRAARPADWDSPDAVARRKAASAVANAARKTTAAADDAVLPDDWDSPKAATADRYEAIFGNDDSDDVTAPKPKRQREPVEEVALPF